MIFMIWHVMVFLSLYWRYEPTNEKDFSEKTQKHDYMSDCLKSGILNIQGGFRFTFGWFYSMDFSIINNWVITQATVKNKLFKYHWLILQQWTNGIDVFIRQSISENHIRSACSCPGSLFCVVVLSYFQPTAP